MAHGHILCGWEGEHVWEFWLKDCWHHEKPGKNGHVFLHGVFTGGLPFIRAQFSSKGFLLPQDSGNYAALTALTRCVIIFKKPSIPLYLHLKVPHALADPCVDTVFPGILISGVRCFLFFFLSSSRMGGYFLPNTKDKLLWRKTVFLMKTQCGSQKSPSEEKGHMWCVILDHVSGISPKGSNLHIQKRTCV